MSGAMLWAAAVGAELLVLACGLLGIAWWRSQRQRSRDRRAVQSLVARLRQGRPEREAAIRAFLSTRFGLTGQALDGVAVPIAKEELRLYQAFANLYLARDAGAVAAFDVAVEAAVAPYWQLQGGTATAAPAAVEPGDNPELDRLRDENRRLSEELQITMNTMSRMLAEYSGMFRTCAEAAQAGSAAAAPAVDAPEGEAAEVDAAVARSAADASAEAPQAGVSEAVESAAAPAGGAAQAPAVDELLAGVAGGADRALSELQGMLDDIDQSNTDIEVAEPPPRSDQAAG